jgi:hypothetical protein
MDTSTNQGLPRIKVRLFLLAAVTLTFGLIWSSDQQYQERELAAARMKASWTEAALVTDDVPIVGQSNPAVVRVAPFAASSWIAPTFATPATEDAIREPVIAPRNAPAPPARVNAAPAEAVSMPQGSVSIPAQVVSVPREPIVSVIVVFRKQSLRVDDTGIVDSASQAAAVGNWPIFEANCRALTDWIERLGFEMGGQTCDMRWQLRRMAPFSGRRVIAVVRRQLGTELDWRVVVQNFARGGLVNFDWAMPNAAAKHAAAPGAAEER